MGRGKRTLAEKVEGFRTFAHKWRKRDEEKVGKEEVQRNRREITSGTRAEKRRMEGKGRSNEDIMKWVKREKKERQQKEKGG